jgi:hypothetical protein
VARDGRGFVIRDEGSRWGIVDRGKRVKLKRLRNGDRVTICRKFVLEFCAEQDESDETDAEAEGEAEQPADSCTRHGDARYAALMRGALAAEAVEARAASVTGPMLDGATAIEGQPNQPLTARELRELREAEDLERKKRGLWGERLVVVALGAVIASTFSVAIASMFF